MWPWLAGLDARMSSQLAPSDFSGALLLCVPIFSDQSGVQGFGLV